MLQEAVYRLLEEKARVIRSHIIAMVGEAGSGHPGGSLSAADILAVLYFHHMNIDAARPDWEHRDRFILSKGHAAPVLYAALAEAGFFPVKELGKLRKLGHMLQGHPDSSVPESFRFPGQGWQSETDSPGCKLDNADYRVYVLMGDGKCRKA